MFRSTMFLRLVIVVLALLPTIFLILTSQFVIRGDVNGGYDWVLIAIYLSMIPFWYALYQGFKLLKVIDSENIFTRLAVRCLQNIKYSAITIALIYLLASPYVFTVADKDDAPGVVLINLIVIGAALVIGTFAAVLQKLFQTAITLKDENDLTV